MMLIKPESSHQVKSVRYTLGPIFFSLGVFSEEMIGYKAASEGRPFLYIVMVFGILLFYRLMGYLLEQRRKHYQEQPDKKEKTT